MSNAEFTGALYVFACNIFIALARAFYMIAYSIMSILLALSCFFSGDLHIRYFFSIYRDSLKFSLQYIHCIHICILHVCLQYHKYIICIYMGFHEVCILNIRCIYRGILVVCLQYIHCIYICILHVCLQYHKYIICIYMGFHDVYMWHICCIYRGILDVCLQYILCNYGAFWMFAL